MTHDVKTRRFNMVFSPDEYADLEIRAGARDMSVADYIRRALRAVAAVGGPEEFQARKKGKKNR